jgi:two-component system NtrC family response regulator
LADVLIIDDDVDVCEMLVDLVQSIGHRTMQPYPAKGDGAGGFFAFRCDFSGCQDAGRQRARDSFNAIRDSRFPPEVIIITGAGDSNGAEIAIRNGAWDYLQKPLSPKKIILPLKRVLQYREGIKATAKRPMLLDRSGIIGNSPQIRACLQTVAQTAHTDASVLITGETGTGKELFARAIHRNSDRATGARFVVVDCAALPENLVESQLFGHEKGAFTGADQTKDGLVYQANGGTLFLTRWES